jgi:hypothetical protein
VVNDGKRGTVLQGLGRYRWQLNAGLIEGLPVQSDKMPSSERRRKNTIIYTHDKQGFYLMTPGTFHTSHQDLIQAAE